jgi:gluconolactonase
MLKTSLKTIILAFAISSCAQAQKDYPTIGQVEILDPAMEKIVDADAKVEKLADGMVWAEGPVWVKDGNYLLYSDTRQNIIYQWSEKNGLQHFIKPALQLG